MRLGNLLFRVAIIVVPAVIYADLYWPTTQNFRVKELRQPEPAVVETIKSVLNFYRKSISPNDFTACPFIPSCSKFMEESIREFGLIGILMGFDRLTRDNPWVGEGFYIFRRGHYLDPPRWHYLPFYWRLNLEKLDLLLNTDQ